MALGDKVRGTLQDAFLWVWQKVEFLFEQTIVRAFTLLGDISAVTMGGVVDVQIAFAEAFGVDVSLLRAQRDVIKQERGLGAVFGHAVLAWIAIRSILLGGLTPFEKLFEQNQWSENRYLEISATEAVSLRRKNVIDNEKFDSIIAKSGYDAERAILLLALTYQYLSPVEYVWLERRGKLSPQTVDGILSSMGLERQEIEGLRGITEVIPTVQDQIRFMVREAYRDDRAAELGLDEDLPSAVFEFTRKLGLSDDDTRRYWRAHWELPSVSQVFEMWHRDQIKEKDVDEFLITADVMPFYREPLKGIGFIPLTRVDVRRMYRTGTLNEEEVFIAYKHWGYNDIDAQRMTDFTVKYETTDEADLLKSEILRAYKDEVYTEAETRNALAEIRVSERAIDLNLAVINSQKASDIEDLQIDTEVERALAGEISIVELQHFLDGMDIPAAQRAFILKKVEIRTRPKTSMPTKAEVIRWYRDERIDDREAGEFLGKLGYSEDLIDLYLVEVVRAASEATVRRWLAKELINEDDARSRFAAMGFSEEDIELLIEEIRAGKEKET